MTALAQRQSAMMASILDEECSLPEGWGSLQAAGLEVYRNNYRTALLEALRSTFERTERLVGKESFDRAAAHHLIASPPSSWTLDLVGEGFDMVCAEFFAKDPEVGELAWLEWAMHTAFVARDAVPMTRDQFIAAASNFGEADWGSLRLKFVPGLSVRKTAFDLKRLWTSLESGSSPMAVEQYRQAATTVVWREAERPVFISVPAAEGRALASMMAGASYGDVCGFLVEEAGDDAIELAGAMLLRWLSEGLVVAIA